MTRFIKSYEKVRFGVPTENYHTIKDCMDIEEAKEYARIVLNDTLLSAYPYTGQQA